MECEPPSTAIGRKATVPTARDHGALPSGDDQTYFPSLRLGGACPVTARDGARCLMALPLAWIYPQMPGPVGAAGKKMPSELGEWELSRHTGHAHGTHRRLWGWRPGQAGPPAIVFRLCLRPRGLGRRGGGRAVRGAVAQRAVGHRAQRAGAQRGAEELADEGAVGVVE